MKGNVNVLAGDNAKDRTKIQWQNYMLLVIECKEQTAKKESKAIKDN